jgi:transcription elongation factor Elf1
VTWRCEEQECGAVGVQKGVKQGLIVCKMCVQSVLYEKQRPSCMGKLFTRFFPRYST